MQTDHILHIIFSLLITCGILAGAYYIKKQFWKNTFLVIVAFACFFMHISTMFTTFMESKPSGSGIVADNQLFPIYFCNFMMYLLLFCALFHRKETRFYKHVATFTALGGMFGGLITLFVTDPGYNEGVWAIMQSAFSHAFLLLGCSYLFVGKYVKFNVYNVIPYAEGLMSCGIVGGLVELAFYLNGKASPNAMYLRHGPVELPEMKWWMFALAMLAIIFVVAVIYEFIAKKDPSTRWYKSIEDLNEYFPLDKWRNKTNSHINSKKLNQYENNKGEEK